MTTEPEDTEEQLRAALRQVWRLESTLQLIVTWSEAYPLAVFPEPDFKKAAILLKAGGITLDAVSASIIRHAITGVGQIAREALKGGINMNDKPFSLGDQPIEPRHYAQMNRVARALDEAFNGDTKPRETGFVLMVFPFEGFDGRCNYISNGADRKDIVVLMKEMIKRFEGQPEVKGHA